MSTNPNAGAVEAAMRAFLTDAETLAVRIDPIRIQAEYLRLPGELAYWHAMLANAHQDHREAELALRRTAARLRSRHRARLTALGDRITEGELQAAVEDDPAWVARMVDEIECEARVGRLRALCRALDAKRDMLVSLGAHIRVELQGDPSLRHANASARHMEAAGTPRAPAQEPPSGEDGIGGYTGDF